MILKELLHVFDNEGQKVIIKEVNQDNNKVSIVNDKVTIGQLKNNLSETLLHREVKSVNITFITKALEIVLK